MHFQICLNMFPGNYPPALLAMHTGYRPWFSFSFGLMFGNVLKLFAFALAKTEIKITFNKTLFGNEFQLFG